MKIAIISCSHRQQSESNKVSKYLESQLMARELAVFRHDCGDQPLPLWTPDLDKSGHRVWEQVSSELYAADGLILVTPEWHGMATPQTKNFFLWVGGSKLLAHKPGLIVSVSAGRGGAYPVTEIRSSSYKNTKINWIPEHLIVRQVESVLNDRVSSSKGDEYIRDRIEYVLSHLTLYAEAMSDLRQLVPQDSRFGSGM